MKRQGLTLLVILATACYSDSAGPVADTTEGRYTLRTVDDQPLPAVIADVPNFRVEFMRGIVTLQSDLSFTDSTEVRRTENQVVRRVIDVAAGTWSRTGNIVTLNSTRGEHYTMTLSGRELRQTLAGSTLLYKK